MSGLTVPRAGTGAGRAAAVQVQPDQMGEIVSQAANVALSIGTQLENDRLSRQAQRLQVDMTADFNNLRLEAESIGDPDQLDQFWQTQTTSLQRKYMEGLDDNDQPRVDPKNADRIGLAFDELRNRHSFAVGARSLGARQSQREADWVRYQHEAGNMAASTPDPNTRAVLITRGDEMINDLFQSGTITAEEAENRRLALRGGLANETAIRQVADDPGAFLAAAGTGAFNDLGAEAVARYSVQAQNGIDAAAAAQERAADKEARERRAAISARLAEYRDIFSADRTPVDQVFMSLPEVQADPDFAMTLAAQELAQERAALPFYTSDQLREAIAEERARPVDAPFQTERLELLEAQLQSAEAGWSSDAIGYAASIGMPVEELPTFDATNPQAFASALERRRVVAGQLVDEGYIDEPRALSEAERDTIRQLAASSQEPDDRIALAKAIIPSLRGVGADNATQFVDDKVFLHVGQQLAQNTLSNQVASDIFRGQQVIAEGNVVLPPVSDRTEATFETLTGMFGELPQGEQLQASIVQSADALYAARIRHSDPAGDIDESTYRQALHEVMGGSGNFNGRDAMGGIQDIDGVPVILPRGVRARDVDFAFDFIDRGQSSQSDLPGMATPSMAVQAQGRTQETGELASHRLSRASLTGAAPIYEGDDLMAMLDDATLQAVGNDRYVLRYATRSGPTVLYDADGAPFQFSLRRLLGQVQP